jgi:hypothetical protein
MYELDKKGAFKAAAPEAIALVSAGSASGAASRHGHRAGDELGISTGKMQAPSGNNLEHDRRRIKAWIAKP